MPASADDVATVGGAGMAAVTRAEIQLLLDELPDDDLEAARDAIQRLRDERQRDDMSPYHRRLLEAGLVTRIPRREDMQRPRTFEPIRIEGKSVSETIIEDRG
jgi:hypothetical protein